MRLDGTTIVVTGASSGLGRAMADAYVHEGASVVYASRGGERLSSAVEAIMGEDPPGEATAITADVRSWEAVQTLVQQSHDRYDAIDILVNNAGVIEPKVDPDHTGKPVHELSVSTWDTILETNLRGAFLCTRAVLPAMLARETGRIIHISSGHGIAGRAHRAAYVASKFGLEGFHESLARELEETRVDSVTLRPPSGGVYTAGAAAVGQRPTDFEHQSPAVIAEAAVQLAAGSGTNGGQYLATTDGQTYVEYTKGDRSRR